jgi:hypothetical protein
VAALDIVETINEGDVQHETDVQLEDTDDEIPTPLEN